MAVIVCREGRGGNVEGGGWRSGRPRGVRCIDLSSLAHQITRQWMSHAGQRRRITLLVPLTFCGDSAILHSFFFLFAHFHSPSPHISWFLHYMLNVTKTNTKQLHFSTFYNNYKIHHVEETLNSLYNLIYFRFPDINIFFLCTIISQMLFNQSALYLSCPYQRLFYLFALK